MAQEQLNHAKPLVPSHLYIVVEVMLEAESSSVMCLPESCHKLLEGEVRHTEYFRVTCTYMKCYKEY